MAAATDDLTPDQRKVLKAARDHPSDDPPISEVHKDINDPDLPLSYVERIMHDFTLPTEEPVAEDDEDQEDEDSDDRQPLPASAEEGAGEDNEDGNELSDGLEEAYMKLLDTSPRQRQLLALLFCSPDPMSKQDIHAILGSSSTYIYQASRLRGPDLIERVDPEDENDDRKLWTITGRGEAVLRRLAKEHTEDLVKELEPIVAITPDGNWHPDWREDLEEIDEVENIEGYISPTETLDDFTQETTEDVDDEDDNWTKQTPNHTAADEIPDEPEEKSALADNDDVRSEIEELSEKEGKDAFVCSLCDDDDDDDDVPKSSSRYLDVRMHITRSNSGRHRGRHGSEPGIIEVDHDLLDALYPSENGHDGSVTTEMDLDAIHEELASGRVSEDPADREDTEDDSDDEPEDDRSEYEVVESDEEGRPVLDGTTGGFQGIHERPAIEQHNDQESPDESQGMHDGGPRHIGETLGRDTEDDTTDEPDAMTMDGAYVGPTATVSTPETQGESTEDAFVEVGLDPDTAFDVITSDAPEEFRRQVFDAVADRSE